MNRSYSPASLPEPPYQTERLRLRPLEVADALMVHDALDLNPEVWRFDPGFAMTLDDREWLITRDEALYEHFGFAPFGAFRKADGVFIGMSGLNPYVFDNRDGSRAVEFEVMFKLSRPFWKQGFATELASFWVGFAFEHVKLKRLITCPARENVASLAVLRRLGATFEDDWLDGETVIATIENARG
jgi:RimJ/RimL family protein N-acetyltransferase